MQTGVAAVNIYHITVQCSTLWQTTGFQRNRSKVRIYHLATQYCCSVQYSKIIQRNELGSLLLRVGSAIPINLWKKNCDEESRDDPY